MMVSTRGRYALRVLIDLAENDAGGYIPMKEVAERQGLSLKYIERIMPLLTNGGLVEGVHGKGGGYRLKRAVADCTVGEILRLTEGELAPVDCAGCSDTVCERAGDCRTMPMWSGLKSLVNDYFDGITLADLMK